VSTTRHNSPPRDPADTGWVGADPDDDLEARLTAEEANEPFDLRQPFVMTLLGPIHPAALGPTLLAPALVPTPASTATPATPATAGDERLTAVAALEDLYAAGGRAVALLATHLHHPAPVAWVAARAPVHLVGPISPDHHAADRGNPDTSAPGDAMVAALTGRPHPGPRAGWLSLSESSSHSIAAVATAHHRTGAAVVLIPSPDQLQLAQALTAAGVPPSRILLGTDGTDAPSPGRGAYQSLLAAGFRLAVPSDPSTDPPAAERQAHLIADLIAAGFADQILLALRQPITDIPPAGPPPASDLLHRLPLLLMETGLPAATVRHLLVDNPQTLLTIPGLAQEPA
jgi:predicted metal-dependent phosphotriesterase family hydrolase